MYTLYRDPKSPYWMCNFTINGRRLRRSTRVAKTGARKPEARRKAEELCHETLRKSETKPGSRITLRDAAGRYLLEVIRHHANAKDEEHALDRVVKRLSVVWVDDIGDGEIAAMVANRRGDDRRGPDGTRVRVSNRTVNADTKLLRALINRVEFWGYQSGPRRQWSKHILPEADERVVELTAGQETKLWDALRKDRPDLLPMIRFALASGMRMANVINLSWDQIDWDQRIITYRAKSKKPGGAVKRLPITGEMMAILQGEKGNHSTRVFTFIQQRTSRGRLKNSRQSLTATGWRRIWRRCLTSAGLSGFHFHDLRHTFATRVLRNSGNLRAVKDALGHSRIETTLKYSHCMDDDVRAAMEAGQTPMQRKETA